jgi:hypothetical protein
METTPNRSEMSAPHSSPSGTLAQVEKPPEGKASRGEREKGRKGAKPQISSAPFLPFSPANLPRCWPATLLASWLIGLLVCCTADAAVRFDMFVGYDGIVPQGSWFPIAFEAQNDGPTFIATVEVTPGQFNSTQTRTMTVELPSGTTKRFIIPTFNAASYNPTWNARVLDERHRVRAEAIGQRVRRLNESQIPLAVAMTRAVPPLPELKNRQEELRPVFGRLQPAVFPDNPLALEGLDTLYLSSERALELKANQVGPLLAWLHGGGHLVVGLEQINHLSGPGDWLKQLLPCEVTGMTSLSSHGEIQSWVAGKQRFNGADFDFSTTTRKGQQNPAPSGVNPFTKLSPDTKFEEAPTQIATTKLRDGRVLIGPAATPQVIIAPRGRGQITLLTFAPELEPFRSWSNAAHFWAKMIDLPPDLLSTENVNRYPGRPIDGVFGAMIDSKQVRKLPVGWLLLLLVGYLGVIGPFDQYWLKKLNKQMLTWITFPAYVAFFSLLIYFIGYKLRAGETEWNELHVVDVIPHGEHADLRGRSYGSIYSPVNGRYIFASAEPFATFRGEFSGNFGSGQESSRATVEQRGNGFRAEASVPVWTSQLFVSDWWRQEPLPLKVTVTAKDVTVDNRLEAKLTAARLVVEDQVIELGEIPARETKSFPRRGATGTSTPLRSYVQSHANSFLGAIDSRRRAFGDSGSSQIHDLTNASMAASFITMNNTRDNNYNNFSVQPGFDLSSLVGRGDAVFLAWAPNYSFTKPLNQFSARRGSRDTLVRIAVEVSK